MKPAPQWNIVLHSGEGGRRELSEGWVEFKGFGRGEVLQNVRIGCGLLQNLFSKRIKKGTIKKRFEEVVNNLWLAENQMDYKIEPKFQKINRFPGERGARWFWGCWEGFGARRRREGWRGGAAALWTPFESMKTRNSPSPCSPLLNHSEWNTFG